MSRQTTRIVFGALLAVVSAAAQQPAIRTVVHAATQVPRGAPYYSLAPNTVVRISGIRMGPTAAVSLSMFDGSLPENLAGASVEVTVGGLKYPARMLSVQASTVFAVIPNDVALGLGTLTVTYNSQTSAPSPDFPIIESSPGAFTLNGLGFGPAMALDRDLKRISVFNAWNSDEPIVVLGTGIGRVNSRVSGQTATLTARERLLAPASRAAAALVRTRASIREEQDPEEPEPDYNRGVGLWNQNISGWNTGGFLTEDCLWVQYTAPSTLPQGNLLTCGGPSTGTTGSRLEKLANEPIIRKVDIFRDRLPGSGYLSLRASNLPNEVYTTIDHPTLGTITYTYPEEFPPDPVYMGRQVSIGECTLDGPGGKMDIPFDGQYNQYGAPLSSGFDRQGDWIVDCNGPSGNLQFRFRDAPQITPFSLSSKINIDGVNGSTVPVRPSNIPGSRWVVELQVFDPDTGIGGRLKKVDLGNVNTIQLLPEELARLPLSCKTRATLVVQLEIPQFVDESGLGPSQDVTCLTRVADVQNVVVNAYTSPPDLSVLGFVPQTITCSP